MVVRETIAVYGGDGRQARRLPEDANVRHYKSRRYGGNREVKRLCRAIKAGSIDRVIILVRWCGHSASRTLKRLCKKRGVPCELVSRSLS